MKIKIALVSFIVLIGLSTFLVSCKKDDDTKLPTCRCTVVGEDEKKTFTIDLSDEDEIDYYDVDVEVGDIRTCKQLENYIEDEYYDVLSASCKER
jgi:hypothetical protein